MTSPERARAEEGPAPELDSALGPRASRSQPVVLGIDPGSRILGYGALVCAPQPRLLAAGEIRTGGRAAMPARLGTIRRELDDLLARLDPDVVVVERAFAARNVQSALRVGEVRGVVLACAASSGARVEELTPAEVKKTLVGNGAADKQQVARMVAILLGGSDLPDRLDVTDALAIALAWQQRERSPRRQRARSGPSTFELLVARLAPPRSTSKVARPPREGPTRARPRTP